MTTLNPLPPIKPENAAAAPFVQSPQTGAHKTPLPPAAPQRRKRTARSQASLSAQGEPMIWLAGGALIIALLMISGLLALVIVQGTSTFWPSPVLQIGTLDGTAYMGEVTRNETFRPGDEVIQALKAESIPQVKAALEKNGGVAGRRLLRTGNFDLTGTHFRWISDFEETSVERPEWAFVIERMTWGRFYGVPAAFLLDGKPVANDPSSVTAHYETHHRESRERREMRQKIESSEMGDVHRRIEEARLAVRDAELKHGAGSTQATKAQSDFEAAQTHADKEFQSLKAQIAKLDEENARYQMVLKTVDGQEKTIQVSEIVRAYAANQLSWWGKMGVYFSRWGEYLVAEPREANSEGGIFPALFGTVAMTLIMSLLVVPFGVLAALYLHEYAGGSWVVSAVRIAVNNLAGVPSIVFGVFGLGFFCYMVGSGIDQILFESRLPNPTFGKGGLLWASLTLALLTLPVVIVATEEALAAVPSSMREGSYGCGASKWQTIQRIVLPSALPGIMTGMILAMARGAGEVAPLMLVGAVKLAPELAVDTVFPYLHPERSFMHLGFHIYDLGFQSQNSEAAKPMVFTTTLLLIVIVAALNMTGIWLRARLRSYLSSSKF